MCLVITRQQKKLEIEIVKKLFSHLSSSDPSRASLTRNTKKLIPKLDLNQFKFQSLNDENENDSQTEFL